MAKYKKPDFQVKSLPAAVSKWMAAEGVKCICPVTTERVAGTSAFAVQPVRDCPYHGEAV